MSSLAFTPSPYLWFPASRGLGDVATQVSSSVAGATAAILALAPATGPAAPFVAAAAALVSLIGNLFHGCGNTCIQATQYANQAGSQLDTLLAQYWALPTPRPYAAQQAYLQTCQQIFAWLQQMCSNPALGQAGQRCISERLTQRACPSTLNDSNIGGGNIDFCDYWSVFYNPVLNDPNVESPTQSTSSPASTGGSTTASSGTASAGTTPDLAPLLLIGGLIALALFL